LEGRDSPTQSEVVSGRDDRQHSGRIKGVGNQKESSGIKEARSRLMKVSRESLGLNLVAHGAHVVEGDFGRPGWI
jgi:hypothetical protein